MAYNVQWKTHFSQLSSRSERRIPTQQFEILKYKMASGTKNKNWVVQALQVNEQDMPVVAADDPMTKLKIDVGNSSDTTGSTGGTFLRIYFPGGIQFDNSNYEQSKGSRLATDMKMGKIPDEILYSFELSSSSVNITRQDDKQMLIQSQGEGISTTEILIQLASKWSLTDLLNTIDRLRK